MAGAVYLHIGLPKTATTYLQTIMWSSRERMRADGVLLPGREKADHLWSTRIVREVRSVERASQKHRSAWERVREETAQWPGTAVITHEFFAAASTAQVERMVADLAPAQVHVVITAREPISLFTTSWQESLKNRATRKMADYPGPDSDDPAAVWNWRTLDLGLVLRRWDAVIPPERIHVLPLPPRTAPRDLIWTRFAELVGMDPRGYDTEQGFANSSMGVAEAETLRRINEHLVDRGALRDAPERGTMIRTYLADERLVPRAGDRFWPEPAQIEDCRRRGAAALEMLRTGAYDVVGDLADLESPRDLAERRSVDSVTDAEVADIATDLVAQAVVDIRRLRVELRAAKHALATGAPVPGVAPARPWWRLTRRLRRIVSGG